MILVALLLAVGWSASQRQSHLTPKALDPMVLRVSTCEDGFNPLCHSFQQAWAREGKGYLFVYLFILATVLGMRDLSSLTRDGTHVPYTAVQSLNHWTTREVPIKVIEVEPLPFRNSQIRCLEIVLNHQVRTGDLSLGGQTLRQGCDCQEFMRGQSRKRDQGRGCCTEREEADEGA